MSSAVQDGEGVRQHRAQQFGAFLGATRTAWEVDDQRLTSNGRYTA
jgi:hypothetical protein